MYAVIESGGKQHRVEAGEILQLEKLDAATGAKVKFDKILLIGEGDSVRIGEPYLKDGEVEAEVLKQGRGNKIKIIKFNRRKHYKKHSAEATELWQNKQAYKADLRDKNNKKRVRCKEGVACRALPGQKMLGVMF